MTFERDGISQAWTGVIETVKPAMGFVNIMTPDFHLHLKGGTVSAWQTNQGEYKAVGFDGKLTGLVLKSVALV